jgi:hypothetical protein
MFSKIIVVALSVLNGGWMLFDGIHVLLKGKYFGPEKPGPWSDLVSRVGIDPMRIGPAFVAIGLLWAVVVLGVVIRQPWAFPVGLIACVASVWYFPIGTILSIAIAVMLILLRNRLFR